MKRLPGPVLLLGGLALGFSVGSCAAGNVPETEIIRVPETKTHVETETVYQRVPIPETCLRAMSLMGSGVKENGNITGEAGEILDALDSVNKAIVMRDFTSINEQSQVVRNSKNQLDNAVIRQGTDFNQFKSVYEQCQSDMEEERN